MPEQTWISHFGYTNHAICPIINCNNTIARNNHCNIKNHGNRLAWEIDHKNPLSRGGSERLSNKRPICCDCNREKSDSTSKRWR